MGISNPSFVPQPVKYLFIDGAYLDFVLDKFADSIFKNDRIELDYNALRGNFKRVFYYHALPGKRKEESDEDYEKRTDPQRKKFQSISRLKGYHYREGVVRRESKKNSQKKVDILIAVDMLSHTISRNMDAATLLSGDLDFQPVLDALVQAGMYTTLLYYPDNTSDELISAADESEPITIRHIQQWLTAEFKAKYPAPQSISDPSDEWTKGARCIRKGKMENGDEVLEFQDGANHIITFPDAGNHHLGYRLYFKHPDSDFLSRYIESLFQPIEWH